MPYEFNAKYIKEETATGSKYTFFCGLSGVAVHTTDPICAADEGIALTIAKQESQLYFNRCEQCGIWIGDMAYNIDEAKCAMCAPFAAEPCYCTECGCPIKQGNDACVRCGMSVVQQENR
jgi:hypothetical protein